MAYTQNPQQKIVGFIKALFDVVIVGRLVKLTSTALVSASNAITLDCSKGDVFTNTPTETTSITAVNFAEGQEITIIFLTSGTSSYTTTFGTGFVSTGTLASGTSDAKRFVVKFVSDGTRLIEVSRTTAM